ncbi:hypothetical protein UAY_02271 [Enterococcus moraviensis ATCC BAA-383]|uniref:DUF4097 domain-containing protein n=1 Tax=Enterococcus moraviensis ATCC BAA-383 TaxID=1158609 RepID=R2QR64_9ENTE|nr:DUF4097 family beta strand repeat-containing protein [Enterococcus moraviensis]EOH99002.1 hypothetical protein UAY_02271 [Enterococcus moraviensis ATCC BAA-383]EOT71823.1 hypothetical protein I586_01630 [Enterococcus moraviensis ATCC BAA-383]
MKRIENFFEEMKSHFLESDIDSFNEIKEDLLEQIEIQLEEGKTEQEILTGLGAPETIAASFYEDKRLDKALKAETDIIAVEDVKKVYKKDRKLKRKKQLKKVKTVLYVLLTALTSILVIYLVGFALIYAVQEKFFAIGPISLAIFFICILYYLINSLKGKQVIHIQGIYLLSIISLVLSGGIFLSGHWYYEGKYYEEVFELNDLEKNEMSLLSEYPVEISTIPIGEGEVPKVEIEAYLKKTDQKNLVDRSDNKTTLLIGKKDGFSPLKKMKKNEVIFYLPQNAEFNDFSFTINHGTVMLSHIQAGKLSVEIDNGEINLNDIYSDNIEIQSEKADTMLSGFYADIKIDNKHGKSILKEGQGTIDVTSKTGLINLNDLTSKELKVSNEKGKNIVSSSMLDLLTVSNIEGISVIEKQIGDTTIKNINGKLVLTDIQGSLKLENKKGQVIISEKDPLDATIISDTGIVKWVQNYNSTVAFNVSSKSGKVSNDFENKKDASHKVSIKTESGDIRIIQKNGKYEQ